MPLYDFANYYLPLFPNSQFGAQNMCKTFNHIEYFSFLQYTFAILTLSYTHNALVVVYLGSYNFINFISDLFMILSIKVIIKDQDNHKVLLQIVPKRVIAVRNGYFCIL